MREILLAASLAICGCSPAPVKTPEHAPPPDPALFAGGTLPRAEHEGKGIPQDAPVLTIQAGSVKLNEIVVEDIQNVQHDLRSVALTKAFGQVRRNWIDGHPGETFGGVVVYRLDRTTPSRLVSQLLFAAAFAGYPYGCFVAMTSNGTPRCIELGCESPEPNGGPKLQKLRMVSLGPDQFKFESGEVVSRVDLRANLAARELKAAELVIQASTDFDLQSLVATIETIEPLVPPARSITLAIP